MDGPIRLVHTPNKPHVQLDSSLVGIARLLILPCPSTGCTFGHVYMIQHCLSLFVGVGRQAFGIYLYIWNEIEFLAVLCQFPSRVYQAQPFDLQKKVQARCKSQLQELKVSRK
jgi:hypothetical protein